MNHSIYSADRATHLKILVLALLAAIAVASLSLSFHAIPADGTVLVTAGKPMTVTSARISLVR